MVIGDALRELRVDPRVARSFTEIGRGVPDDAGILGTVDDERRLPAHPGQGNCAGLRSAAHGEFDVGFACEAMETGQAQECKEAHEKVFWNLLHDSSSARGLRR